ncbi:DNA repair protein RecN [Zongyangia hominis]|uniref:DNA repair protein RecN n=1 Tax=Zongyangia hominis TaxID=2763677 RepID=A0A926ECU0_9FIRM|nr:DNA repair protein RecN [Zongyangia hominis]MBC8569591.1 DNA repair protein RecN [Zongyangia hominis]
MLKELYIKNIAVIKQTSVCFSQGLNVFTGETGAGKSIIIDSINAVLGQRISRDLIRTGEERANITAVFSHLTPSTLALLKEMGYEADEGELMISRELSADGKGSCRLCGRPIGVTMLRELGNTLINIHGQHDSQYLLNRERHIDFLDSFAGLEDELSRYRDHFSRLLALKRELNNLNTDESEKARQIDLLEYQIGEIEQAELIPGEEEDLSDRRRMIRNAEQISLALESAHDQIGGGEEMPGALELIQNAAGQLQEAAKYLETMTPAAAKIADMGYELEDLLIEIKDAQMGLEYDAGELEDIEARLDLISRLKRKYGGDIEEILQNLAHYRDELQKITFSDERKEELTAQYRQMLLEAKEMADHLSQKRRKAAHRFEKLVEGELGFLDMPSVKFVISISPCKLGAKGLDDVEFLISTNPGEPPKPIAKIASGGELSRIMLSLKNVISDKDDVPTLIFDEVDTGVSGSAAEKIGRKLRQVAQGRQVICVTHLAQIAALSNHHLLIAKHVEGGQTYTQVNILDHAGRVREIARIMSGVDISDLTLQNAEEMLRRAENRSEC